MHCCVKERKCCLNDFHVVVKTMDLCLWMYFGLIISSTYSL